MTALRQYDDAIPRCSHAVPPTLRLPAGDEAHTALKADLARRVAEMLEARGGTQRQAAADLGISQPKISDLKNGKLRGISVEKLLELLVRMGCAVDISVRPPYADTPIRLRVTDPRG